jgi:hypothetical protein
MTLLHDTATAVRHAWAASGGCVAPTLRSQGECVPSMMWNGTLTEQLELVAAVERNCECKFDTVGVRLGACPSHTMLVRDQRALNGLL